jgi:hypothetical protein
VNGGGEGYCAECFAVIMQSLVYTSAIQGVEAFLESKGAARKVPTVEEWEQKNQPRDR